METIVGLADCNSFYASCERALRPEFAGKPLVVLSNNDTMVVAASPEAKALGVDLGDPLFRVRRVIESHGGAFFSSNYTLYADLSQRVMETLKRFVMHMEVYSIDEAFLSLSEFADFDLASYACSMRKAVREEVGIPLSVGIGGTKTLAKAAVKAAKKSPEGVFDIRGREEGVLGRLPVEEIWGIGRQYGRLLRRHGVCTALAFIHLPERWVLKHMTVDGARTQQELKGIPCLPLQEVRPPRKELVVSRGFGRVTERAAELEEALCEYAALAARRLRREGMVAGQISAFIMTSPFRPGPQYTGIASARFPEMNASTVAFIREIRSLLARMYRPGYPYRKAGVILSDLGDCHIIQGNLFVSPAERREHRLLRAVDQLNDRYGREVVRFGAVGLVQPWRMRREALSPHATTRWEELPQVNAS